MAAIECQIEGSIIDWPSIQHEKYALSIRSSELLLDARNVQLLRLLTGDPRMTISELARRVEMSAPGTRERIRRLHCQRRVED